MRDVLPDLLAWWRAGETVGIGTVVGTWRSAPRQPGAAMLVGPDESAVGSVSGGCVESRSMPSPGRWSPTVIRCCSATGSAKRRIRGRPDLRRDSGRVRREGVPRELS